MVDAKQAVLGQVWCQHRLFRAGATIEGRDEVSFNYPCEKVRRLGLAYLLLCLLVTPLAGCGKPTPTPEPVTITFAHPGSRADDYEDVIREFNESCPHITIEMLGRSVYHGDVFVASQDRLYRLLEQESILSLDPFVEQDESLDLSDFYPGTAALFTKGGELWAIPSGVDALVMFYNQELFDHQSVPYPEIVWTWDDFLSAALAIRDPESGVFGYASTMDTFDLLFFIYQHGGRILDDLQNPTRPTFDDPLTIEALEWYVQLMNEYDVMPTPEYVRTILDGSGIGLRRAILQGKVGMWMGSLSEGGGASWLGESDLRWGMVPLPRDASSATWAIVEGYSISAQTQHPDTCWQWLAFLSQQMPPGLMPARKSLAESAAYQQLVGSDVVATARASMESAMLVTPELEGFMEAMQVFFGAVEEVIEGRSSPGEAMNSAQRQVE